MESRTCRQCGTSLIKRPEETQRMFGNRKYCSKTCFGEAQKHVPTKELIIENSTPDETGCWIWKNKPTAHGYGAICINYKVHAAHRLSYEMFKGELLKGFHIDHLCRKPMCVNPAHLEQVTPMENTMRGVGPASINKKKTVCIRGHELTRNVKTGYRICKTCEKVTARRYKEKMKHRRLLSRQNKPPRTKCDKGIHDWIPQNRITRPKLKGGLGGCRPCANARQREKRTGTTK